MALGLTLSGAVLVMLLADALVGGEAAAGTGRWLRLLALSAPLQALTTVLLFALRGRSLMLPFVLVLVLVREALTPALLLLLTAFAFGLGAGAQALVAAYLGAHLCALPLAYRSFRSHFPELDAGALLRAPRDRELLRFAFPQGLSELLNLLLARADILMIAHCFPAEPELVAAYAVASLLAGLVKKVRQGFDTSFAPELSRLIKAGDPIALDAAYAQVARWVLTLWIALGALLGLAAPLLLSLFGPAYAEHWELVPVLIAGRLVSAAAGPVQMALLMIGRARLELLNNAAINALDFAANALLIPRLGIVGAALGTALSLSVFGVVRLLQLRQLLATGPAPRTTGQLLLALGLGLLTALFLLHRLQGPLAHILAAVSFLTTYAALLWILNLLPRPGARQPRRL